MRIENTSHLFSGSEQEQTLEGHLAAAYKMPAHLMNEPEEYRLSGQIYKKKNEKGNS